MRLTKTLVITDEWCTTMYYVILLDHWAFTYRYKGWWGMRYRWASLSVRSWGTFLDCCRCPPSALCPTELQRHDYVNIAVKKKKKCIGCTNIKSSEHRSPFDKICLLQKMSYDLSRDFNQRAYPDFTEYFISIDTVSFFFFFLIFLYWNLFCQI